MQNSIVLVASIAVLKAPQKMMPAKPPTIKMLPQAYFADGEKNHLKKRETIIFPFVHPVNADVATANQ